MWRNTVLSFDISCQLKAKGKKDIKYANKYRLLTKYEVKMAGYWPSSFFACLWTETESRSITRKKE